MRMNVVFPAAVGAEESADFTRANLQTDMIDGHALTKALGHAANVDG